MNCNSCGANLPPGATVCPVCGTPVPYPANRAPYNAAGPGNPSQIDPTVAASPYGTPSSPSTAYGAQSYGTPPPPIQPSQNPYEPANAYGSPPPQYPYAAPPQNTYGAPPLQQGGYGQPGYLPPGQGAYGIQPPPPRRRSRAGLIIGIVVGVLVLACIGAIAVVYQATKGGVATIDATATAAVSTATASSNVTPTTPNLTPTVGQGTPPSGLSIDTTAASYITNPQMSSAVDSNYHPTAPSTTFTTSQTIYATFKIASNTPDGYVTAKWYSNGTYAFTSNPPLAVKGGFTGYLAAKYHVATQGTVEYYFCTQKDCSDAKLANVLNFTVTSTGMHWIGQPAILSKDINRPE